MKYGAVFWLEGCCAHLTTVSAESIIAILIIKDVLKGKLAFARNVFDGSVVR